MIWWAWVLSGLIGCAPALCQVSLTEAVQATLARHPQLEVQRERVVEACSRVKQASGIFDVQVDAMTGQSYTHLPLTGLQQLEVQQAGFPVSDQSSNVTTATGSASRLLPGGIAVTASASLTRATDNLVQTGGTNLSQIRLQLNIPMLRGRGRAVVTADEAAAKIESDASVYDLNHLAATLMSDTA